VTGAGLIHLFDDGTFASEHVSAGVNRAPVLRSVEPGLILAMKTAGRRTG
jgi:hypothetical protein